jgi:hypothetical protein
MTGNNGPGIIVGSVVRRSTHGLAVDALAAPVAIPQTTGSYVTTYFLTYLAYTAHPRQYGFLLALIALPDDRYPAWSEGRRIDIKNPGPSCVLPHGT